jgi:2-oxoglutarate dehydrogenase E2 component (dihydrolipoamide succinyltransferase)
MSIEVKVPQLPESVADATVAAWHKKAGDFVARDENLVDLETDKVVLEVPSPCDGIVGEILQAEGETVTSNQLLGLIEKGEPSVKDTASAPDEASLKEETSASASEDTLEVSPAVRRLISEHEIALSAVSGTGKGGKVTKEDVLSHLNGRDNKSISQSTVAAAATPSGERE